ncbi:BON domain-containing protein [Geobacter sp. SVR]|uniref:BON domain-containing protein n=1 Tax=Geobacter sp. SVR TaxID=2495594 RepID=UPI00143EFB16|nr:BON domain-containing protein [Geobacter sp. SVR]BCS54017.1 BON domain-containing protein [Geobacter sp. SVR]GCF86202.1 BON domain-containing protein [Geobacter sp. SVR]
MKPRYAMAAIMAASALLMSGLPVHAADSDAKKDQTMGQEFDDATITTKVKMELMGNRSTSAMHTDVTTNGGVVTLTGKARSQAEKDLATAVAKNVKGVASVNNQMIIDTTK